MADWTPFFVGMSAAAATLAGLLFLGVQFNIDELVSNPGSRWYAVARSTFTVYAQLLLVPLILILTSLDQSTMALVLIIVGLTGVWAGIRNWMPVWSSILHRQE